MEITRPLPSPTAHARPFSVENNSQPEHSPIGASSMDRWANCPGSVRLSKGMESKSSVYADEGTLAHAVAAEILRQAQYKSDNPDVTEEMLEAIDIYTQFVFQILAQDPAATLLVEKRLDLTHLFPRLYGTGDAIIYQPARRHLYVMDYKHGKGLPVEIFEDGKPNSQLMYYALGALEATGFPCETVELVVIQPRCGHPDGPVRRHKIQAIELIDFADDLVRAAKRTLEPDAPLNPGDWCRFCPAAGTCPELHSKALVIAREEFKPTLSYDPAKLAATLEWLDVLDGWIKSVREFAYGEAEHGRNPPGWKLVAKRATRKWRDEDAMAKELEKEEKYFKRSLLSVAQVEKILGKSKFSEVFGDRIVAESSGYTLARESDKRDPAKLDAKSEFTKITSEN